MCSVAMLFDNNNSFRVTASLIIILLTVSYSNTVFDESQLYKGDSCILRTDGTEGKCVLLEECPSAHREILERKHPQICIFHKKDIIVCCPNSDFNTDALETTTRGNDNFNAPESTTRKSDTFDSSDSTTRRNDTFDALESTTRGSDTFNTSESTTRKGDTVDASESTTRKSDTVDALESTTRIVASFDAPESTTIIDTFDALGNSTRLNGTFDAVENPTKGNDTVDVIENSTKINNGLQSSTNTNVTLEAAESSISSTNNTFEIISRNNASNSEILENGLSNINDLETTNKGVAAIDNSTNNINDIFETTESSINNAFQASSVQISTEKCLEYEALYNVTKPKEYYNKWPVVVGGEEAEPKEFPHMALLGYGERENKSWLCGGSLISMRHVLTAAHCLYASQLGEPRWILMGFNSKRATTKCGDVQKFEITEIIKHPGYKYPSAYNDIAILKLDRDIRFTKAVRPACLNTDDIIPVKEATATGWGLLEFNGNPSDTLQKVLLDIFTTEQCSRIYSTESKRKLKNGLDSETQLCAGSYFSDKDTCKGDSGGPLQIDRKNSPFHSIIGITSFGKGCGVVNMPAIYTKVSNYVPWIESIVWPQLNSDSQNTEKIVKS